MVDLDAMVRWPNVTVELAAATDVDLTGLRRRVFAASHFSPALFGHANLGDFPVPKRDKVPTEFGIVFNAVG